MDDKRKQANSRRNRHRRGAGIEMAMILMVVAVAFSGLLVSMAIMQLDKQNSSNEQLEQLEQRMALDRIGRDFCSQRANYVLPSGVTGDITRDGCTAPDCCSSCAECNDIYKPLETEEVNGSSEDTGDNETTNDSETTIIRPECCNDCAECTIGCTNYTHISLVVYSDESKAEVVLTVVMVNNGAGTHTVAEWSYGE